MANSYGSVLGQEQQCGWLAHDVASTDDDRVTPFDLNLAPLEDFNQAPRRAWCETPLPAGQFAHVDGVESVDVLVWRDAPQDLLGVDVLWQWQLDEDSIDLVAGVKLVDHGQQIRSRRFDGKADSFRVCAYAVAGADLVSHVDPRSRILADQHCRKARANAVAPRLFDPQYQILQYAVTDCVAIQNARGHAEE